MTRIVDGTYVDDANATFNSTLAPVATAKSYAAGAVIGGTMAALTFTGPADGHNVMLRSARLRCLDGISSEIDVVLFNAPLASTIVDGSNFASALLPVDIMNAETCVKFSTYRSIGAGVLSEVNSINSELSVSSGQTLYAVAVAVGPINLAGASDLQIELAFEEI